MYRTLIAAAAFAVMSLGAANVSHAQDLATPDQYTRQAQAPGEDVQGRPVGEPTEGENVQSQDRFWVWYGPACWSRLVFVGYNWFGRPLYQRYVWCR